ncbi:MAG: hypothetical protein M1833_001332, partial [Piccolia ochrophora]
MLNHLTPGYSKTQIAIAYCYQQRPNWNVFWVNATEGNFVSGYERIATAVGLSVKGLKTQDEVLSRIRRFLESESNRWLLVLDNADDPHLRELQFRPRRGGVILITSRTDDTVTKCANPGDGILLKSMMPTEAKEAFLRLSGWAKQKQDETIIDELLKALGYLPLAISQAAAFVSNKSTPTEYLELFHESEERRVQLLKKGIDTPYNTNEIPPSVMHTWNITLSHIRDLDSGAVLLLRVMAFFDSRNIRREYLQHPEVSGLIDGWLELLDAIALLKSFALISQRGEKAVYDMHPLVSLWTRKMLQSPEHEELGLFAWSNRTAAELIHRHFPEDVAQRKIREMLLPHALAALGFMDLSRGVDSAFVYLQSKVAFLFHDTGAFATSEKLFREALAWAVDNWGPDHSTTLGITHNLSNSLGGQGKTAEAVNMIRDVVEKRKRVLGEEHPETLRSLHNLALRLLEQGRTTESVELLQDVSKKQKRVLGEEHPDTLRSLHNLANRLSEQGKTTESVELLQDVIEKRKRVLGEEHPETL